MEIETLEAATPDQIWEVLRAQVRAGRQRSVPAEETLGCVLARDARCIRDFPPCDRAFMNGYAVRLADFGAGSTRLRSVSPGGAGGGRAAALEAGTCTRVAAGACVPAGTDAVVMVEDSRDAGDGLVEFDSPPAAGQYIDRAGSLIKADELLVRAGTRVSVGTLAALVVGGAASADIFAPPRVAQLTTGDESAEQGLDPREGQAYDSNSITLEELIRQAGGETVMFGRCPEDPAALHASLELGLANELLCITGGSSTGMQDRVPGVLEGLGVRWLIHHARITPGWPLRIGRAPAGCWVIVLPGNPVGCAVCFYLFGRVLLEGLQGLEVCRPPHIAGRLEADMPAVGERHTYRPAEWSANPSGEIRVTPLVWRGAGDPFGLAIANALICRPPGASAAPRGQTVQIIPLDLPR